MPFSRLSSFSFIRGLLLLSALTIAPATTIYAMVAAPQATVIPPQTTVVTINTRKPLRSFIPEHAFGAGIDGHEDGDTAQIYTPATLAAMRSAGLGVLSYRLRTELGIEAWHWNPRGRWSDAAHQQGYWTSDATPGAPITTCYGYRLPRRGSTIDQANNDGYSRLDDGDINTFWKTNPYLDARFTGESNRWHPQWAVIDLGKAVSIDTARLDWGIPFATAYHLEYWSGPPDVGDNDEGAWHPFPGGHVEHGKGGTNSLRLTDHPVTTQFVRLWLTASSHTAPAGTHDIRDSLGYALREIGLGLTDASGQFHDCMRHAPNSTGQTTIYTSSCDSWHRASDIDHQTEQPGFDVVRRSGLTRDLPMLAPIAVLYDTPENAKAELVYLKARGIKLRGLELGEEPDGQIIAPADYGALYRQFARVLRHVDTKVPLGGPSFQTVETDYTEWPEPSSKNTWLGLVLHYLNTHGTHPLFQFCSFEWYPFDDVRADPTPCLRSADSLLDAAVQRLRGAGLGPNFPLLISEYGYSVYGAQAEVDLPGMLFNADCVAHFLELGGDTAYLYGYEPESLINEGDASTQNDNREWGNNMLFLGDSSWHIRYRMPTYYGARLVATRWAQPWSGPNTMFPTFISPNDTKGTPIRAYTLRRPDGRWSVLLLNESSSQSANVTLRLTGAPRNHRSGPIDEYQYCNQQYQWHADKAQGYPPLDLPPAHHVFDQAPQNYELPPYSLTIIRGIR